jgi:death-on-curing protein
MTEEKPSVRYLNREGVERIHAALSKWADRQGEPIPSFALAKEGDIDALVAAPRHMFYGQEAYPTLAEKAAIVFYTVNKRQIFLNGNKRMSTLCLLVFLGLNGKDLGVTPDELTAKALWLANTSSLDFPAIKAELTEWIGSHLRDIPTAGPASS